MSSGRCTRNLAFGVAFLFMVTVPVLAPAQSTETNPYMGAQVTLATAPNGAVTNKRLLDSVGVFNWLEPTVETPAPGIYVFGGFGLAPVSIIETDQGLIAFDTGDTKHDGELIFEALRKITDKPIKVIIYGHSHTVAGAEVLAEGQKDVMIIGHPNLNAVVEQNLGGGGAPAFYPEVGPYLTARALTQFNAYMPKEGPDAYVVPTNLTAIDMAFLPVNRPVQDGEEMTILGIRFQFFTKYGSDDKVHTTVWLPDRNIVFTTLLWSAPPQLYSLRGDVFRDPREWIAGLRFTRDSASRRNRASIAWFTTSSGDSAFTATSRLSRRSRTAKTSAKPPRPTGAPTWKWLPSAFSSRLRVSTTASADIRDGRVVESPSAVPVGVGVPQT